MADTLRLATFNLENLDDAPGRLPPLPERIAVLRPQLLRSRADILFLQEVNGQPAKAPRRLAALDRLLAETPFAAYHQVATESPSGGPMDKQNLVILSRWPIAVHEQVWHILVPPLAYRMVTPAAATAPVAQRWDRPLLYARVELPGGKPLHALNLHLRAPLAAAIAGRKSGPFCWNSTSAWAEGFYMALLKRSGQALEARLYVDALFDNEPQALIAVCGDFNAEATEMPTRILMAGDDDTGNMALRDRMLTPAEDIIDADRRFSVIHAGRAQMLDHILVSPALARRLRRATIDNDALTDELEPDAIAGVAPQSHHALLVAEFDLPET